MSRAERVREPNDPLVFPHFVPRLWVLAVMAVLLLLVMLGKLASITLLHGAENRVLADSFPYRLKRITAPRGMIVDRQGAILASNRLVYDVTFSRIGLSRAQVRATADHLESFFPKTVEDWREILANGRGLPRQPVTLARGLTLEQVAPLTERLAELPGISVQEGFDRNYPVRDASLGHILGYVNDINPRNLRPLLQRWGEDVAAINWDQMNRFQAFSDLLAQHGYALGDDVGVQGLEYSCEDHLRGRKGEEVLLQNAHSQVLDYTVTQQAEPGHTLHLTLDLRLQRLGHGLLAGQLGAIIAMDPRDGAILALVSSPGFDSDQPASGRGWAAMVTDNANRPLVNRAMREVYNPGSTLKPIVALGALRDGAITPDTQFDCDHVFMVGRVAFHCDYDWGCGTLDLRRGLRRSCNIYFYNTARRLGEDGWRRITSEFGLFQPTGIDLPHENPGHAPGSTVYPGELVQLGIGQGPFDVTPLQMVRAYAEIAVDHRVTPHLVGHIDDVHGNTVWKWEHPEDAQTPILPDLRPDLRQAVIDALSDVVYQQEGTARRAGFPREWRVAGKTGTAQNRGKIDAWFIGFAPVEAPEIVVGCVVEGAGHGADAAAPLVREMMRGFYSAQASPEWEPESLLASFAASREAAVTD
jgi:penicillin-binding protein 2